MKSRIRRYQEHGSEGFTLIELLIVIIIIGILAAIVVFSVQGVTNNGAKSACQQTVNEIQTAIEADYASSNGATKAYPTTLGALVPTWLKSSPVITTSAGAIWSVGGANDLATLYTASTGVFNGPAC